MHGDYLQYALLVALAIALLVAAITDFRRRKIDNWLTLAVALGAPLFWYASSLALVDIGWQFAVALVTFMICAALFAVRAMGGGDVKLLTALALWLKPLWFMKFLIMMSLVGGLMTICFGAWHIARRNRDKCAVPYGLAIACAGLWALASQYLPGAQTA